MAALRAGAYVHHSRVDYYEDDTRAASRAASDRRCVTRKVALHRAAYFCSCLAIKDLRHAVQRVTVCLSMTLERGSVI